MRVVIALVIRTTLQARTVFADGQHFRASCDDSEHTRAHLMIAVCIPSAYTCTRRSQVQRTRDEKKKNT